MNLLPMEYRIQIYPVKFSKQHPIIPDIRIVCPVKRILLSAYHETNPL